MLVLKVILFGWGHTLALSSNNGPMACPYLRSQLLPRALVGMPAFA